MNSDDLERQFKKYAIDVALLIKDLPKNTINIAYSNQLVRASSSQITERLAEQNQWLILLTN